MPFRESLLSTLRAVESVLRVPGVMVVGSEVPNLLQPGAASTLVVSEDVDIAIPVHRVDEVRPILRRLVELRPSEEEPSVWIPVGPGLIEANFLGLDASLREAGETYVRPDPELPLLVFGTMGHVRPGKVVVVDGITVPLPTPASLMVEKLLTDRTAEKGVRDLLVVAGLVEASAAGDLDEFVAQVQATSAEARYMIRSNLTLLSLLAPIPSMPNPLPHRQAIAGLLGRLESA